MAVAVRPGTPLAPPAELAARLRELGRGLQSLPFAPMAVSAWKSAAAWPRANPRRACWPSPWPRILRRTISTDILPPAGRDRREYRFRPSARGLLFAAMDIQKLQRAVIDALEDVKAQDIKVFNTTHLTSLFDRVVIASATSNRQTRALASSVADRGRAMDLSGITIEGEDTGEWVVVDLGDVVVHIMQPAIRQYYNLEEIWAASRCASSCCRNPPAPPPSPAATPTTAWTTESAVKLIVAAVGTRMPDWVETAWNDYAKRLPPDCALELREIKPEPRTSGKTPAQMMAAEAKRIDAALPPRALRLALDERGRDLTTVALSQKLEQWRAGGGTWPSWWAAPMAWTPS